MAQSYRCSSCLCNFETQIKSPRSLPCGHQVCQICTLEEYQKNNSNQCPKRECKGISFTNAKTQIDQNNFFSESLKEFKKIPLEERKNEIPLQKNPKKAKIQILTDNKEEINLSVQEGDTIEQLKQRIEIKEGIYPDFYELYKGEKQLDRYESINKMESKEKMLINLKLNKCNQIKIQGCEIK